MTREPNWVGSDLMLVGHLNVFSVCVPSDGGRCGAAPVVDLLRKPCISVHRDVLGGTVYQQCVPLATGIYRGHPELQR